MTNWYLHAAVAGGIAVQAASSVGPWSPLLGAALPLPLWPLVFGGALLAWALATAIARLAWRGASTAGDRR